MPSSWDAYYVVFLSAFLALLIPAILKLVSRAVAPKKDATNTFAPSDLKREQLGRRMNSRFFLAANSAVLLIALGLCAIPSIGILRGTSSLPALISILTIAALAALGLLYAVRKG